MGTYDDKQFKNLWPSLPEFREVMEGYYKYMEAVASEVMEIVAVTLRLPRNYFKSKMDNHLTALRISYYPKIEGFEGTPPDTTPTPEIIRAGAHSDWGTITILYVKDDIPGLQFLDQKTSIWHSVQAPPGSFIINIADLLSRWTNNKWKSTIHRVIADPIHQERLSFAFFNHPNSSALIECIPSCLQEGEKPKNAPITSGEYLKLKFEAIQTNR